MIDVKGLTKRFGTVTALDNISFQVDSGSIFGLVGSNGAGKSTFLRTAAGIYRPDAGMYYQEAANCGNKYAKEQLAGF